MTAAVTLRSRQQSGIQMLKSLARADATMTSKYMPDTYQDLKSLMKRDHASDFLKSLRLKEVTNKADFCKTRKISVHTLNEGLSRLGISTNKRQSRKINRSKSRNKSSKNKSRSHSKVKAGTNKEDYTEDNTILAGTDTNGQFNINDIYDIKAYKSTTEKEN